MGMKNDLLLCFFIGLVDPKEETSTFPSSTRLPKLFLLPNDPPTFNFTEG